MSLFLIMAEGPTGEWDGDGPEPSFCTRTYERAEQMAVHETRRTGVLHTVVEAVNG